MIQNYLKIAFRNLLKHKGFSFINIFGLFLGTACCLYIVMYTKDQYGYDIHHDEPETLFRITTEIDGKDGVNDKWKSVTSSPPIAPAMQRDFPEVKAFTRIVNFGDSDHLLSVNGSDNSFYQPKVYFVDSTFFQVFNYKFIEGNPKQSMDRPYTIVISSAVAKKLFGNKSPINQIVKMSNRDNKGDFTVTGVFDEKYGKSHLRPNILVNMNSGGIGEYVRGNTQWAGNNFVHSYIRLHKNANAKGLEAKLPAFLQKYGGKNLKELGMKKELHLQAVTDIHLSGGNSNEIEPVSSAKFLYFLLMIAGFIQLIACINFMNLTTARSLNRAKEIGIRKVSGAFKGLLIGQFLGESFLLSLIAVLLSIPVVYFLLPFLNSLTGGTLNGDIFKGYDFWLTALGLALTTGILAGIYPAFYLSSFQPVSILKGSFRINPKSGALRKGLVVFQFAIAIVLIIGVMIIGQQMKYIQSQDLGFDRSQKLIVDFQNPDSKKQLIAMKNEIAAMKEVEAVATANYYPGKTVKSDFSLYPSGSDMNKAVLVKINRVDEDYFKTMGIKLLGGRNFTHADTTNNIILNEKALKILGLKKETAIGAKLFNEYEGQRNDFTIIGVINDHNFASLKSEITPMVVFYNPPKQLPYLIIEAKTDDYAQFLAKVEGLWNKSIPGIPFEYSFFDDDLQKQYAEENTLMKIFNVFMTIAILISCLGLFGLATFTAQTKTKEIGIRKVLGASVISITALLSKDFLKLVLIAFIIAAPLAWYFMYTWLKDFAYKTDLHWWIFAIAGAGSMLIALITVSYQAIRASLMNPVKSLKSE